MTDLVAWNWTQAKFGGGGYITGLTFDPNNPETLYARCDVAGAFKSVNGGESWTIINNGMTAKHHHLTQALAVNPFDSKVLLRGSGDARDHKTFGTIHRSDDGGQSWSLVTHDVDFSGNGATRTSKEMIDFSPRVEGLALAGAYSTGTWLSRDGGKTFSYSGLKSERIGLVKAHPHQRPVLFAATIGDSALRCLNYYPGMTLPEKIDAHHDVARGGFGRLYASTDDGASWELLCELPETGFYHLGFDPQDETIVYAATNRGLLVSRDGGRLFEVCYNGLPADTFYAALAVDGNDGSVYASVCFDHSGIPIYRSEDQGRSWALLKEYTNEDLSDFPHYIKSPSDIGGSISTILMPPTQPGTMYISNYFGVSKSTDDGKTWRGHQFRGTETLCGESIFTEPVNHSGTVYIDICDHPPAISTDFGESYELLEGLPNESVTLVVSRHKPNFMVCGYGRKRRFTERAAICVSDDGGKTSREVKLFNGKYYVQALREDLQQAGTFYALVEGDLSAEAGVYKSIDWGQSWDRMSNPFPAYMKSSPHNEVWIDDELLNIAVNQRKNVAGNNQIIAADPFANLALYVGEWTEGLFKTTDGGVTWVNIGASLPFKKDRTSVLISVKADENRPGVVYAGFIREGLWRSENSGETWNKIFPLDDWVSNVSALDLGGSNGDSILFASESLDLCWCPTAVMLSRDFGASWQNIYDPRLGAVNWKGVALDAKTDRVYGLAGGNGLFYADAPEQAQL